MNDLETLRQKVTARLTALEALKPIPVLCEDRLDLNTEITKALAQAGGAVIVISTGDITGKDANIAPPIGDLELVVEVSETPILNRSESGSKIPAITAANRVAKSLHHFQWAEGSTLVFSKMRSELDGKSIVLYTIVFKTSVLMDA